MSRAAAWAVLCTLAVPVVLFAQTAPRVPAFQGELPPEKSDWIQIYSLEWLKGDVLGMYDGQLEFDSAEFDIKTFKWYDVRELRTSKQMTVGLLDGRVAVGKVVMILERVIVIGETTVEYPRSQLLSISPALESRRLKWAGKMSAGLTVLAGNVDEVDANVNGYLKRRTVADRVTIDFIANLNSSEGNRTSDNSRINGTWDHFITDRFFLKALAAEWYRDPFQNISSRNSIGSGAGYQIIDRPKTTWEVSAGLGFQRTHFVNVEGDEEETPQTGAFSGSTKFEHDFTRIVEMNYEYTFHITNEESGRYNHHMLLGIETDWTDILDFDITLVWDRTQLPQAGADGVVPEQDDFRMVIGIGLEF